MHALTDQIVHLILCKPAADLMQALRRAQRYAKDTARGRHDELAQRRYRAAAVTLYLAPGSSSLPSSAVGTARQLPASERQECLQGADRH